MSLIKLVENYAISQLRKDVRDSLMMAGEQAIVLQLFHAGDADAKPCPQCGDDIYKSPEADCFSCFGTMFEGGVRTQAKVWTLFTDKAAPEQIAKQGVYQPDQRSVQLEYQPLVVEHDVLVRVRQWGSDGKPGELEGYYILQSPQRRSLRTGNRFGQYSWDVVGQKAQLSELPPTLKMITNYPIEMSSDLTFVAPTDPTALPPVTAIQDPEAKVVYYPVRPSPFAQTIGDGIHAQFAVNHNLGSRDVTVSVYNLLTGEEGTPDIFRISDNAITVRFKTAPAEDEYRVVVAGGTSS